MLPPATIAPVELMVELTCIAPLKFVASLNCMALESNEVISDVNNPPVTSNPSLTTTEVESDEDILLTTNVGEVTDVATDIVASRSNVTVPSELVDVVIFVPPDKFKFPESSVSSKEALSSPDTVIVLESTYAFTDCCVGSKLAEFESMSSSSTNDAILIAPSLREPN